MAEPIILWQMPVLLAAGLALALGVALGVGYARRAARQDGGQDGRSERSARLLRDARIGLFDGVIGADEWWCDEGFVALYGLGDAARVVPREEFMARLHPDDRPRIEKAWRDFAASGQQSHHITSRAFGTGGAEIRVRMTWVAERGADRGATRVLGWHAEQTDALALEHQLCRTRRRLDLALQASGMGLSEQVIGIDQALFDQGMIDIYDLDHTPGMVPMADWRARIHPDDLPSVTDAMQRTRSIDDAQRQIDFRAIRSDGAVRLVRANWVTEFDDDGNAVRLVGMHSDLTQIRGSEQEKLEATERLALITDNLPGAVIQREFVDKQIGALIHVSPNAEMIWGYTAEEILADPDILARTFDPDFLPEIRERMQKALTNWEPLTYRFRITHRSGETRWVEYRGSAPRDRGNGRQVVEAIFLDITQEVEMQRLLETLLESLPGAVFQSRAVDQSPVEITYMSKNCLSIWGYTAEELIADPEIMTRAHDPDDVKGFLNALRESARTGEAMHRRYWINTRDGQIRWVDFHGSATSENGVRRAQALMLDVTKEVEAEAQADEQRELAYRAQKTESIGHLTGGVAHDFNNLLAVVLGNLEILQEDDPDPGRQKMISTAISATLKGADLTKKMLAFARRARLEPEVLDINNVVREAQNWMGRTLPESIEVETSLLAGLWKVEVDPGSLESAVLNLILNARDAMEGKGRLTIETANVRIDESYIDARREELEPGRYVMLAISDTGPGIPADLLGSIFEPFFTTKPPGAGSGLGLPMVMGFVKQSGGTIQVYSEPGEGTTFKLYFPAATGIEQPHAKPLAAATEPDSDKNRVLVVEDEDEVRRTLVTVLERAGYRVVEAASGDRAKEIFTADPAFDLLLTDIVMPGTLQGTTLSKALRKQCADLPVVFMSGYASEATVHGNGLRPEDIRLMKPVQRAELLAAVSRAIAGRPVPEEE